MSGKEIAILRIKWKLCLMKILFSFFFFAMIAIYNYSDLKEYQRMAIIYISVSALVVLNIIGVKLELLLLVLSLFCFLKFLRLMR